MSEIIIQNNSQDLFKDLKKSWQDDTTLVFASPLAREEFLSGSDTLFNKSALTLIELWDLVALKLNRLGEEVPAATLDEEILPLIRSAALKTGNHELISLAKHRNGFKFLLNHLNDIERVADQNYQPTNDLEKGIEAIRQTLFKAKKTTLAGRQSIIARQAFKVQLDFQEIIFAPLPEFNNQLGGLIKGLSKKNNLTLHLLFDNQDCLKPLGLNEFNHQLKQSSKRPNYFIDPLPKTKKEQVEAGFKQLHLWRDNNLKKAVVIPTSKDWLNEIVIASNSYQVNIFYRDFQKSKGLSLAQFLIDLDKKNLPIDEKEVLLSLNYFLPEAKDQLTEQMIKEICQEINTNQTGTNKIRALVSVGSKLDFTHQAAPWLERLLRIARDLDISGLKLEDQTIETILNDTGFPLRLRGKTGSVAVVSYQDLPQLEVDQVIFLGFDQTSFNFKKSTTFASKELLKKAPELAESTGQFILKAAVLSPKQDAVFFKGKGGALMIERDLDFKDYLSPKLETGQEPSRGKIILDNLGREVILEPTYFDSYSVSGLEKYLACPRGWFVEKRLKPNQPISEAALTGNLRHFVLENLQRGFDQNDINDLIDQFLNNNLLKLSLSQRVQLVFELEKTAEVFLGPAWPFTSFQTEVPLKEGYQIDEYEFITITGKADRVDWSEDQKYFFVTDFKSSNQYKKDSQLQIHLYPELIKKHFKKKMLKNLGLEYLLTENPESREDLDQLNEIENNLPQCAGSIYFSVPNQKVSGFDNQGVINIDYKIPRLSEFQLNERLNKAFLGINDSSTYLNSCGESYCSHNLLLIND